MFEIAGQGLERQIVEYTVYHNTNLLIVHLCVRDNRRDSLSSAGREDSDYIATGWLVLWIEGLTPDQEDTSSTDLLR
jgi:hypothetical protein